MQKTCLQFNDYNYIGNHNKIKGFKTVNMIMVTCTGINC